MEQFKHIGLDLDEQLLIPVMNGARILTGDGRKVSLRHTDLGLQLRVEELEGVMN